AVKADDQDIAVLAPGTNEPRILIRGASNARYLPTGHIVFVHDGALLAVGFNLSNLSVTGTPVSAIEGLAKTWGGSAYSISENGTLVYEPDTGLKTGAILAMVDRKGSVSPITTTGDNFGEFSISPNGRSLATRIFAINDDIWTYDIATGTPLRLTFEPLD